MSKANMISQSGGIERDEIEISVVVPCYNAEENIENCIRALLEQSYPVENYEIIMVDNNSTDNTAEIIKNYPRIKLLSENKQGSYAARNHGVAESKGRIIAFTDSDCVPDPEWLEIIFESMRSPGIGIIQGGRVYGSDSPALSLLTAFESERAESTFSGSFNGNYYGYTNNMAVRRDVFERSGPFLEVMRGADSIFVNRAVQDFSSELIRYMPGAIIRHMEITSSTEYFHKKYLYGKSLQQNYSLRKETHRNMALTERYSMIKRTIERNCFSILQSIFLVFLITIGMISFRFGRLSVTFKTTGKWFSARIRKR